MNDPEFTRHLIGTLCTILLTLGGLTWLLWIILESPIGPILLFAILFGLIATGAVWGMS